MSWYLENRANEEQWRKILRENTWKNNDWNQNFLKHSNENIYNQP